MFHSLLGGGVLVVVVVLVVVLVGVGDGEGGGWVVVLLLEYVQYMLNVAVCPGFTVCELGEVTWQLRLELHSIIEMLNVSGPLTAKLPEALPLQSTTVCP
jgi:hypothetical protein